MPPFKQTATLGRRLRLAELRYTLKRSKDQQEKSSPLSYRIYLDCLPHLRFASPLNGEDERAGIGSEHDWPRDRAGVRPPVSAVSMGGRR